MFDAGAIQAHLDIDTSLFDRKLTTAEERVKAFERGRHEIRISAVFDNASLGRARQIFTQLDQQLSREAMQRLRSSPQGSVLGALNALFSPHPVSGGPSPQQSASQGLLGRIISAPGGGGPAGTSASRIILGQAAGTTATNTPVRVKIDNVSDIANAVGDSGDDNSQPTLDPGAVSRATQAALKAAEASRQSSQAADDATQVARDAAGRFTSSSSQSSGFLTRLIGQLRPGGGGSGAGAALGGILGGESGGAKGAARGLAGGLGPGILGLSTRVAGIVGLGGSALGALPALLGVAGAAGITGAGAGLIGLGAKTLIGTANQKGKPATEGPLYQQAQSIASTGKSVLADAAGGMLAPLKQAFSAIPGLLKGLEPELKGLFGGAGALINPLLHGLVDLAHDVLPGLSAALKAVAPLVRPLVDGLGGLLKGILPGLTTLLRAAGPAVAAFGAGLGSIGKDLGSLFADAAPVIKQSSVIFKAILDVIGSLLPAVGSLAAIFARTLAPIFVQFAGVVKSLIPFITIIAKVMAQLADAVLGDLVSAFGALAQLLKDISPALTVFAGAFSKIFTVLENSGVFAIIGDALEGLVKPLATLINALLRGLAPILPVVIKFLADLSAILVAQLVRAVSAILPPLTKLATVALAAIAQLLPIILPLITSFVSVFTGAVADTIVAIADGLNMLLGAIPPNVLKYITEGILAIVAGLKLWAAIQAVLDIELSANPLGILIIAIAALTVGIVELVKHWNTVWHAITSAFDSSVHFISDRMDAMRKVLVGDAQSMWQHLTGWGDDVKGLFTRTIPGWWDDFIGFTSRRLVRPLQSDADDMWHHFQAFGGWISGLFTRTIPGFWSDFISLTTRYLVRPAEGQFDIIWTHLKSWGSNLYNFLTRTVPGYFSTAVSSIGRIWSRVEGVIKAPVKFVVDDVLNGLITVFDTITSAIGLGKPIKAVHPFGLAEGGRLPGFGGGDQIPALLEPGETVIDKHRTQAFGWLFKMLGVKGFAEGGIPGGTNAIHLGTTATPTGGNSVTHFISSAAGKLGDTAKIIAALASGNSAALTNAFSALLGKKSGAAGELGTMLAKIPHVLVSDIVKHVMNAFTSSMPGSTGGSSGSVKSYASIILRALSMLGLPAGDLGLVERQMQSESGGNPTIVNRWDSNWLAGHPSVGLMQVIAGTFARWAGPFRNTGPFSYGVSTNPLANIYAALNYAIHGAGIGTGPGQLGSGHGYSGGGMIREPIIGFGRSGQRYTFGENGAQEWVTPVGKGGGDGASQLMGDVYLQMPEGTTVAQALAELYLRLRVAQQQGYLGVGPA
jgi:SLT domain-containing protein/phage-related protein